MRQGYRIFLPVRLIRFECYALISRKMTLIVKQSNKKFKMENENKNKKRQTMVGRNNGLNKHSSSKKATVYIFLLKSTGT